MASGYLKKIFVYLIFLFTVVPGFSQKRYDFKKAEEESRRLIYGKPDSALVIIKKTLAQPNIHDTVYGNTYNLYAIYYGMKGMNDSIIYYTKKSLTYVDDYPKSKARSLMNLSLGYRNKGEYKTAIGYIKEAIKLYREDNNEVGIAIAYGEMASNYNYMLDYDTSVKYLLKSIDIFKAQNDTIHLAVVKQKLANTYMAKSNFNFAIDLYKECLEEFKASGMDKNYYLTLVNLGDAYINLKKYKEAEKALAEAITGLQPFGDKELIGLSYAKIGSIYVSRGRHTGALSYYAQGFTNIEAVKSIRAVRIAAEYIQALNYNNQYSKALEIINRTEDLQVYGRANIEDQMLYNNVIAVTYKATGNSKKAIAAFENTIRLKDSIADIQKQSAVEEIQGKFQTQLQREKNQNLEARNKALTKQMETEKRLIVLYTIAGLALLAIFLLLLRGYWLKNKLQKQELKSAETDKYITEQKRVFEQQLINKQTEVIEEKQRELTSSALVMANFQDSINKIISNCNNKGYKAVADVKKELEHLTRQNDYWKQFEKRFNTLHPEFTTELTNRYDALTKNDVEFCSLLKLNLTNKEIAALLQISHESVITKKYRIKKKMGINDDSEFENVIYSL